MMTLDCLAAVFLLAQVLFAIATTVFAISAIDDLIFDALFFIRHRRSKIDPRQPKKAITLAQLKGLEEQPLAIMLPAWKEAEVLVHSVQNIIHTIEYKNFHIFIGTYPNDADTQAQADLLAAEFTKVHKVVTPLPGPTCKADCLNAVIAQIQAFERREGIRFAGYILHDAEDVVHPLSLHVYNYYLPEYDIIQIPVLSLPRKWYDLTGGHYMDEFAEVHSKEIFSRQYISGVVPGAGVGTAYSLDAIRFAGQSGEVFNTASLTEDYEFSFRAKRAGLKQIFARIVMPQDDPDGQLLSHGASGSDIIATREYFPNVFWAAVRQKTRWFIGIGLQGWQLLKWRGSWRVKYMLWRDRKMLFFSHAIVAGLFSFFIFCSFCAYQAIDPLGWRMAPLMAEDNPFWYVVYFNLAVLLHRIIQRSWWTYRCYGLAPLPLVLPRYVWGSVLNYIATVRAIKIYFTHRLTGRNIGWDKTTHEFPQQFRRPLSRPTPAPFPVPSGEKPV